MRVRIVITDLRVTDRVFTVMGDGPIALTSVKHGKLGVRFKREDGWSESFFYTTPEWDRDRGDLVDVPATMTVERD